MSKFSIYMGASGARCHHVYPCLHLDLNAGSLVRFTEILSRYGWHKAGFECRVSNAMIEANYQVPWAIIVFPEEYRLAGHLMTIRNSMDDFRFSAYSVMHYTEQWRATKKPPTVSVVLFYRKAALERTSWFSPLFRPAWETLGGLSGNQHWFCISPPPPAGWLAKTQAGDDLFFIKQWNRDLLTGKAHYPSQPSGGWQGSRGHP